MRLFRKGKTITLQRTCDKNRNKPKAYRLANAKNPLLEIIPCHRVIRSDGKMGGYISKVRNKLNKEKTP